MTTTHDRLWAVVALFALIALLCTISHGTASDASRGHPTQEIDQERLADAIYLAEGGINARKPFGVLSVPCEGYDACRRVCLNTIRNTQRRWKEAGQPGEFITYLGQRYAPPSVHHLNTHWSRNVQAIYDRLGETP